MEDIDSKIAALERSTAIIEKSDNIQAKRWFWFKLALLYSSKKTEAAYNKASTCLQNSLRLDRNDVRVWQAMGEVYLARGSYLSAMKAFQMALKIRDESDEYTELKIADIQRILGKNVEAIDSYERLLQRNGSSIPCLVGLARCKLDMAEESFRTGLLEKAYGLTNAIIDLSNRILSLRKDLCAPFNLIANCCLMVILFDERSHFRLQLNGQELSREAVIETGLSNLKQALKLSPESSQLWHNLALFEWTLYRKKPLPIHKHIALSAIKRAISIDFTNQAPSADLLNSLAAIICEMSGGAVVAQHSLLKAISLSKTTTEQEFTNLGVIALNNSTLSTANTDIVHHCFSAAQAQEPAFTNCWAGQSLLAQHINHHETEDLFRHSATLALVNREAQRGFVYHALSNRTASNYIQAIDAALALLQADPSDIFNYNSLGLLLERRGELLKARDVFCSGSKLISINKDGQDGVSEAQHDAFMLNYARLIVLTSSVPEIDNVSSQLNISEKGMPYYVLALYKNGNFEQALNVIRIIYKQTKELELQDNVGIVAGFICRRLGKPMIGPLFGTQLEANEIAKLVYVALDSVTGNNPNNTNEAIRKLFHLQQIGNSSKLAIKTFLKNDKWLIPLAIGSLLSELAPSAKTDAHSRIRTANLLRSFPNKATLWLLEALRILLSLKLTAKVIERVTRLLHNSKSLILHAPTRGSPLIVAIIYSLLAHAYSAKRDRKATVRCLQRALVIRPDSAETLEAIRNCTNDHWILGKELLSIEFILHNVWRYELERL